MRFPPSFTEARGVMFVGARTEVYNGMIFGEHSKDSDLDCNPCNAKHVSNVRTAGKDEFIQVRPTLPSQTPNPKPQPTNPKRSTLNPKT
jgi:predicted membrane GTPase involved in stress response